MSIFNMLCSACQKNLQTIARDVEVKNILHKRIQLLAKSSEHGKLHTLQKNIFTKQLITEFKA